MRKLVDNLDPDDVIDEDDEDNDQLFVVVADTIVDNIFIFINSIFM